MKSLSLLAICFFIGLKSFSQIINDNAINYHNNISQFFSGQENSEKTLGENGSFSTEKITPVGNSPMVSCCCNTTIQTGSFIINMGISPQTFANGLYPYGMIYDLIKNYGVPIIWSINPAKAKDGADFSHNGVSYKGGTFIIPKQFITAPVQGRITYWQSQGVVGAFSVSTFNPPIFDTLTSFPTILIDNTNNNDGLMTVYFSNANIPASSYTIGNSSQLGTCFDIWSSPHTDPSWTTHQYLYNYVTVQKGWIFVQCHTASMVESCQNPVFPFTSLHFLTQTGLQCFTNGSCNGITTTHVAAPSAPFTYSYPADPPMQFMGNYDGCSCFGSERWYIPITTGGWYAQTKRSVTTSDGVSPQEGALVAYGPCFGNTSNGKAMYVGGHQFTNPCTPTADQVAGTRAYFNYLLWTGINKKLKITLTAPATLAANASGAVTANVTTGSSPYTYSWSSTLGGTFNNNSANPTYTAPNYYMDTLDVIKVVVTDNCGRKNIRTICVNILGNTLPVELLQFRVISSGDKALLVWSTSSEVNNDYFGIEKSKDAMLYENIGMVRGHGNSTTTNYYEFIDAHPYPNISYYRLAQTDFNGRVTNSQAVALRMGLYGKGIDKLTVIPNPVLDELFLFFLSDNKNTAELKIYNSSGKMIVNNPIVITEDENLIKCNNISDLNSGIFYATLTLSDGQFYSVKFIKK